MLLSSIIYPKSIAKPYSGFPKVMLVSKTHQKSLASNYITVIVILVFSSGDN